MNTLAELITLGVAAIAVVGELLHARRVRRLARLSFGPSGRPMPWTMIAPALRVAALAAICWGLVSLGFIVESKKYDESTTVAGKEKHLILLLDVSPSMTLEDSGANKSQARRLRASDVVKSLFDRIPIREFLISVIAVYTKAKPVVEDSTDVEIVRHFMEEIPLWRGFSTGKTDLFAGLIEAARIAKPWSPRSTSVVIVTDGDTVPASGMPKMPASVANILVIGVGDVSAGKFIHGHQSRQDVSTLQQVANRLGGTYHNGNQKHLSSNTINVLLSSTKDDDVNKWTRREYALLAVFVGSLVFAILPILLHYFGSSWRPGVADSRLKAA